MRGENVFKNISNPIHGQYLQSRYASNKNNTVPIWQQLSSCIEQKAYSYLTIGELKLSLPCKYQEDLGWKL